MIRPDTPEEVANRLSQELAIDCKSSGSQKTTRLEQAIETIQGVLFATRMGRFSTTPVLGTVNPSASWALTTSNGYSMENDTGNFKSA